MLFGKILNLETPKVKIYKDKIKGVGTFYQILKDEGLDGSALKKTFMPPP